MTVFNGPPGCEARGTRIAILLRRFHAQGAYGSWAPAFLPPSLFLFPEKIVPVEESQKRRRFMHGSQRVIAPHLPRPPLECLLSALLRSGPVRLTLCRVGLTAEVWGDARMQSGPEWLTLTIGKRPDCLHVRREALRRAQFIDAWGIEKSVHFIDDENRLILRCTLVDTAEGSSLCVPARLAAFRALRTEYGAGLWLH